MRRLAPAKVNLFLHVGPVAGDGYHPVASLMVFADVGDELAIERAEAPGLVVDGPFAPELASTPAADNLVWRAAQRLLARTTRPSAPFVLRLTKRLPVAAGLGGGSSDAGAALELVRAAIAPELTDAALVEIAGELGADGPACLAARPVLGLGRGDELHEAPALPELHAVLVNPRVACPTGAVYRGYDAGPLARADVPALPTAFESAEELAAVMATARNDLEPPAAALVPAVAEALALVRGEPETLLGRLSGSGATVFALVAGEMEAHGLAERLQSFRPDWWVQPCRLAGPWS